MNSAVLHAKEILLHPREEWRLIDDEKPTIPELLKTYIAPLAAIGPIAATIGFSLFGVVIPFVGRHRVPFGSAVAQGIVRYVLAVASVFAVALVIDGLAPTFGGQKNRIQALKVAAYASTAAWLAGAFTLVPPLAILGVLGLYSLYLLYLGLPVLMKVPQERALGYTATVVLCAVVLFVVIGWLAGMIVTVPSPVVVPRT